VAAVWTYFVARCCGIVLPWTAPAAMFTAVWMIYAADRLLDARALDIRQTSALTQLEERHRFHHRHRGAFLAGVIVTALVLVLLLPKIHPRALVLYVLLATLLAAWMLIIHVRASAQEGTRRLPKELAVGIFFPAACFIPTVAHAPWLQLELLPTALVLAGVCTLNCLFLYAWEHPSRGEVRRGAHWTTRWATRHLPQISGVLMTAALVVAVARPPAARCDVACALSVGLLLLLHLTRDRFDAVTLRAAADLTLLTPLFIFLPR
jgi:hypothetical protein